MQLLTVKELAERLRVSLATAYALVKRCKIASLRVGGAIRIRECDLDTYMSSSTQPAMIEQSIARPVRVHLKHLKLKK